MIDARKQAKAFAALAEMQDGFNKVVNPDWRESDYPFYRAVWTEAAEALGHVQWEWWKTKTVGVSKDTNVVQIHLELVDILHFGLSMSLLGPGVRQAVMEYDWVGEQYHRASTRFSNVSLGTESGVNWELFIHSMEEVVTDAILGNTFNSSSFFDACRFSGLSILELIALYHGKNVLNHFRQEHGYKQGTYKKEWRPGQEDNVVLAELVRSYRNLHREDDVFLTRIGDGDLLNYLRTNLSLSYNRLLSGLPV